MRFLSQASPLSCSSFVAAVWGVKLGFKAVELVTLRLGWKPNGFFRLHGFSHWLKDCIPLAHARATRKRSLLSVGGAITPTTGRIAHAPRYFSYIECSFDTHTAIEAVLSGVYDSLVYLQRLRNTGMFLQNILCALTHTFCSCSRYYTSFLTQQRKSGNAQAAGAETRNT